MYGAEIWGFHNAEAIERIHTSFCKKALRLKRSTSNSFIYGELGRTPLKVDRYYSIIKYWLRMVMYKPNPLVYQLYIIESQSLVPGVKNWSCYVCKLLGDLGFFDVWLAQGVVNDRLFLVLCKQ